MSAHATSSSPPTLLSEHDHDYDPLAFEAAADWLSSTPAVANLPNQIKLELYGLFKFVTTGAGPSTGRPGIFDFAGRAKFDAWVTESAKYGADRVGQARERYVALARGVGWTGQSLGAIEEDVDLDRLDDEPETGRKERSGNGTGRGVKVSVMAEGPDERGPIHDAVIDNDLDLVQSLLRKDKALTRTRDEMVRTPSMRSLVGLISYQGNTPLHLAADRGHIEVARTLLGAGADRQAKTPLQLAETLDRKDMMELLR
ncbi:hypothetical protein EHS25_000478 [Saitozyma podzolica]|uniref:ACB domain-containing protein n=1 Tax=Saitozyma podzolica TaxID=1890683 RepID=A0A427YWQ5_9TREE|nr:hypothetical protein EHS25_000478 [Saitozyma podzolica]